MEIANSPFTMSEFDSEPFSTGRIYTYSITNLDPGGGYSYYFEAYDQHNGFAGGDGVTGKPGPIVNGVLLTAPNGDEQWYANQDYEISWEFEGSFDSFDLEYSTNNGTDWNSVTTGLDYSLSSYIWTIPNSPSANCLVRVIGNYSTSSIQDESDAVFEILEPIDPPNSFSLISPNNVTLASLTPTFEWNATTDPDGNSISYDLWYATNPDFINKVTVDDLTTNSYTPTVPLNDNSIYYWKVKAVDGDGQVTWCTEVDWYFDINLANNAPNTFTLSAPTNGNSTNTTMPTFEWSSSYDVDPGDEITYTLWVGTNYKFLPGTFMEHENIAGESYTLTDPLNTSTYYYWKVKAVDTEGASTWCIQTNWWFLTPVCTPITPCVISDDQLVCENTIPNPLEVTTIPTAGIETINFQWQNSLDNNIWDDISGELTTTYQPPSISQNTYYRLTVSANNTCNTIYSNTIEISIPTTLSVTITDNQSLCVDNQASAITSNTTGGKGTYQYQWQKLETDWVNVD